MHNDSAVNTHTPDSRVKVPAKENSVIAKRIGEGGRTQLQTAKLLAVARETIRDWEAKATRNGGAAKRSKPDVRVKVLPQQRPQMARLLGVSRETVS